jgi:hypothetical protein
VKNTPRCLGVKDFFLVDTIGHLVIHWYLLHNILEQGGTDPIVKAILVNIKRYLPMIHGNDFNPILSEVFEELLHATMWLKLPKG